MDKINLASWQSVFGKAEQQVLHASERYTDLRFRFEEPGLAAGAIQVVSAPGMRLTELSMQAGKPFRLVDTEGGESAESVFVLHGDVDSSFDNLSSALHFQKDRHNFQYNREFGGEHTIGPAGFHALTITYELSFLQQLLTDDHPATGKLANAIHGGQTYVASPKALGSTGRIAEILGSVRLCPFSGITRYLFLESKMMELFALQLEQASAIANSIGSEQWSPADRERLHAVKNYIETSYLESFSLRDLTYQFGLNEFKLKKGYKQLFGSTVFGHVHRLRMQEAKRVLTKQSMNVSEAAFFVGYNNVSSFCTEFKKQFGYSPGRMREQLLAVSH